MCLCVGVVVVGGLLCVGFNCNDYIYMTVAVIVGLWY